MGRPAPRNFHLTDEVRLEIARAEFGELPAIAERLGLVLEDAQVVRRNARKRFGFSHLRPEKVPPLRLVPRPVTHARFDRPAWFDEDLWTMTKGGV